MDSSPVFDLCILLVAPEISSLWKSLKVLLDGNYRVAIACNGEDALTLVKEKKRRVNLVLTETNLPDMCAFMFVQILTDKFKLPVVMLCEFYHIPTITRGLSSGARFCLWKPLTLRKVGNLWCHCWPNDWDLGKDDESEMLEAEDTKGKIQAEGHSMGQIILPDLRITCYMSLSDTNPLVIILPLNTAGLTIENIAEKLQAGGIDVQFNRLSPLHEQAKQMMSISIRRAYKDRALSHEPDDEPKKIFIYQRFEETSVNPDRLPWAMDMYQSIKAVLGIRSALSLGPVDSSASSTGWHRDGEGSSSRTDEALE